MARQAIILGIRCFLALVLFKYGWDKVFLHQFSLSSVESISWIHQHVELDMRFWELVSRHPILSFIAGLIEVALAFGLFFHRSKDVATKIILTLWLLLLVNSYVMELELEPWLATLTWSTICLGLLDSKTSGIPKWQSKLSIILACWVMAPYLSASSLSQNSLEGYWIDCHDGHSALVITTQGFAIARRGEQRSSTAVLFDQEQQRIQGLDVDLRAIDSESGLRLKGNLFGKDFEGRAVSVHHREIDSDSKDLLLIR